jgi:diguanylate cyclase (GGDEF)-like protein
MDQVSEAFKDAQPIVLVIDDSVDVHRLLKARLRHEEIDLVEALGGVEGLEAARELQPAVILLDLDMPDTDGFQVLRQLKNDPETRDILVMILSAAASTQDKVTAFDLGAVDYVVKPFNLTELRVRLRSALRTHRLLQLLAQRAQLDGLTGLWNRAYFNNRWADEVAGSTRHGTALSIAMIDVDHFKSVNDSYGHPTGDQVLQGLGKLLSREVRQEDVACRYGGEEFVLILPHTGVEAAAQLCDRVREACASLVWSRHPERSITISIGVAGSDRATDVSPEGWMEIADRALYEAKQGGRNRVSSAIVPPRVTLARAG